MALTLRQWLKHKLDGMVSIQTALLGRAEADLVVNAWSGKQLRIHLIAEAVRPRALKNALQNATEIGVNTMFLVDARLFPEDGKRLEPKEWMHALHILTNERIYTFRIQNARVELRPLHLEEIVGTSARKAWFGPAVNFERIRFYRTTINKPRSVRGDWMVADFGSHAFWRNIDYRNYQTKHEQEDRSKRRTYWETWSNTTWDNRQDSARHRSTTPLQANLEDCYKLLGVAKDASQAEVKRAYRKLAITVHPDTSELPNEEAVEQFRLLSEAYDYIRSAKGWD